MPPYAKATQLHRDYPLARNPTRLRAFLRLPVPRCVAESQAERYDWCAFPRCPIKGTRTRPLEQHHIIPRSQDRRRIDDVQNHLYLCESHHKGLHGEGTPGRMDWIRLGVLAPPTPNAAV